jgi:hypothetical protein
VYGHAKADAGLAAGDLGGAEQSCPPMACPAEESTVADLLVRFGGVPEHRTMELHPIMYVVD